MSRKKTVEPETVALEEEVIREETVEELPGEETPEKEEDSMEQIIYLGPTKKGIVSGTVFIGGLTETATALIEAVPAAQLLFVSIPETAAAMAEIQEQGTARQIAYDQAWKAKL